MTGKAPNRSLAPSSALLLDASPPIRTETGTESIMFPDSGQLRGEHAISKISITVVVCNYSRANQHTADFEIHVAGTAKAQATAESHRSQL